MKKLYMGLAAAALLLAAGGAIAQLANSNYREAGGLRWVIGGSLDVESGGEIDIESGAAFKIAGSDLATELAILDGVTASTADLNATTNFEETISATTSEVTIAAGKTLDVPAGNLQIANTAITATAAELNVLDNSAKNAWTHDADITVSDESTGGDAGARNTIGGLFNIAIKSLGSMTNGSAETIALTDDTPAGECAGVNQTTADDAAIYRVGSNSLKVTFASSPSADDGADCTITADDFGSNESIGFWFRTDTALSAGDVYVELDDDGGTDVEFDLPAVATINQWTWIELDITTCATCDIVDGVKFLIDAGGATTLAAGGNIWIDFAYKWDADDEETLGVDIVQDGVLGVITAPTAAGSANTTSDLAENTGFFVNYQSGNDVLVTVTDQSANYGIAFLATQ